MKKLLLLANLSLCIGISFAQSSDGSKYAATITGTDLKKHLTVIASDEMEGRETGTEGQRKAAAYIESQFKAIGLKAPAGLIGYQQLYPLWQDSLQSVEFSVDGKPATFGTDFITPLNV